MRLSWLTGILMVIAAPCVAQSVAWDQVDLRATSFTVQIGTDPAVTLPATARSYPLPSLPAGTYPVIVAACTSVCTPAPSVAYLVAPAPVPVPATPPVPDPVPVPTPAPVTCLDGSASFPLGFVEWVYTKVSGSFTANSDYKRLTAAGWTYVTGSAYRQRANYYNLQFRCGA